MRSIFVLCVSFTHDWIIAFLISKFCVFYIPKNLTIVNIDKL